MAYISVCYLIISHIFPFADILFETALFPFLIGLRFDVRFLFLLPQICVSFLALISRIRSHTWVTESHFFLHCLQKGNQCPDIIPILENIRCNNIFTVYTNLHVISRLQLCIPHVIIFHVHKRSVRICFTIIIPSLETGCMPVINSLAFQKTAEQLQIPLVPAFASSFSMYKNGMLFFTYLFYKTAYLLNILCSGFFRYTERL